MPEEKQEKKVQLVEIVVMTILLIILWVLNDVTAGILDYFVAPALQAYYFFRGLPWMAGLTANIASLVPVVNLLPTEIAGFLVTVYIANNPKLAKVAAVAQIAEGKVGGAKGATKTAAQEAKAVEQTAESAAQTAQVETQAVKGAESAATASTAGREGVGALETEESLRPKISEEQFGLPPESTQQVERESFPAPEDVPSFPQKAEEEVRPVDHKEKAEPRPKENTNEKPQEPTPSASEEQEEDSVNIDDESNAVDLRGTEPKKEFVAEETAKEGSNPEQVNPNSIFNDLTSMGSKDLPTSPDKVYRTVQGKAAIDDIDKSGIVRNKQSAGIQKSRWGERVFWSRGGVGKNHIVSPGGYVIEAPHSIASKRVVKKEDITAIHTKNDNGEIVDILKQKH